MKKIRFPQDPLQPFQTGQVWELDESFISIGDVGKLLVDYRHHKQKDIRGSSSLTSKRELKKYLTENKAVLVQGQRFGLLLHGTKKPGSSVRG